MTHQSAMWLCIFHKMPRKQWVSLDAIYHLIEHNLKFDDEDYQSQSPSSDLPKWKRNVRNVLQYRKKTGDIEWDGHGKYRL